MTMPRNLPLYDPAATPSSWNEWMQDGEYAVHFSVFHTAGSTTPYCTVFPSLGDAEAYSREQVQAHPDLRCSIYDSQGFIGAPIREIRGQAYKDRGEISSRFRRWCGGVLFFGGLILAVTDWSADFRYLWPSALGTRMFLPGAILLFTEAMVMLHAHRKAQAGG